MGFGLSIVKDSWREKGTCKGVRGHQPQKGNQSAGGVTGAGICEGFEGGLAETIRAIEGYGNRATGTQSL